MVQAIPPVATHFSIAWSVCRLSHSCTLLKPFDGFWCHLAGTLVRSNEHCVRWGSLTHQENGDLKVGPPPPQPKHAVAKCCWHLANDDEKWFCVLPLNHFGPCCNCGTWWLSGWTERFGTPSEVTGNVNCVVRLLWRRDNTRRTLYAAGADLIRGCQTIDRVGQLLWAWFSWPRKSADKIVEPWHTAEFIVCNFVRCQLSSRIHNSRMQIAKWYLRYFSCIQWTKINIV